MTAAGRSREPPRAGQPLLPPDWRALAPLLDAVLDAAPEHRAALIIQLSAGDPRRERALSHLVAECERSTPLLDRAAAVRFDGLRDESPDSLLPEILADRYQVGRELGRGGMARVYLARDLKHGREVAIKVIRPDLAASLGHGRFLREIEIAARLNHPNILPLHDSGEVSGSRTPGRGADAVTGGSGGGPRVGRGAQPHILRVLPRWVDGQRPGRESAGAGA